MITFNHNSVKLLRDLASIIVLLHYFSLIYNRYTVMDDKNNIKSIFQEGDKNFKNQLLEIEHNTCIYSIYIKGKSYKKDNLEMKLMAKKWLTYHKEHFEATYLITNDVDFNCNGAVMINVDNINFPIIHSNLVHECPQVSKYCNYTLSSVRSILSKDCQCRMDGGQTSFKILGHLLPCQKILFLDLDSKLTNMDVLNLDFFVTRHNYDGRIFKSTIFSNIMLIEKDLTDICVYLWFLNKGFFERFTNTEQDVFNGMYAMKDGENIYSQHPYYWENDGYSCINSSHINLTEKWLRMIEKCKITSH